MTLDYTPGVTAVAVMISELRPRICGPGRKVRLTSVHYGRIQVVRRYEPVVVLAVIAATVRPYFDFFAFLPLFKSGFKFPVVVPKLLLLELLYIDNFVVQCMPYTRLEPTKILLPLTSPASTDWNTIRSKKLLNTSDPQRFHALERILFSGIFVSGSYSKSQSQSSLSSRVAMSSRSDLML